MNNSKTVEEAKKLVCFQKPNMHNCYYFCTATECAAWVWDSDEEQEAATGHCGLLNIK